MANNQNAFTFAANTGGGDGGGIKPPFALPTTTSAAPSMTGFGSGFFSQAQPTAAVTPTTMSGSGFLGNTNFAVPTQATAGTTATTTTAQFGGGFFSGAPATAAVAPQAAPATATPAAATTSTGFGITGISALGTVGGSAAAATPSTAPTLTGFGSGSGFLGASTPIAKIATTALGGGSVNTAVTTAAAAPTFSFGAAPAASVPAATTTSTAVSAPVAAAGTSLPAFTLPAKTTAPTFSLGTAPTATSVATSQPAAKAPAISTAATTSAAIVPTAGAGFASLSTATKTTNSAAVANAAQMTYNQLEEHINKWTLELEEQEKVFTDQATQINAWDKVLIHNNQNILELNDAVQKVKADQQTLEQELEFIATQHKELEESIVPLQQEFMKMPQVDMERSNTYLLVENLDTQLKQMSEDLKEIIDNLNESNKGQDNLDPVIQIGKILNAHMSSLQWIESSSSEIMNQLEDITKMHETFKRDSERSFRSAYYN